jgi:hypothetical protein
VDREALCIPFGADSDSLVSTLMLACQQFAGSASTQWDSASSFERVVPPPAQPVAGVSAAASLCRRRDPPCALLRAAVCTCVLVSRPQSARQRHRR